jgi:hypothetical protein
MVDDPGEEDDYLSLWEVHNRVLESQRCLVSLLALSTGDSFTGEALFRSEDCQLALL